MLEISALREWFTEQNILLSQDKTEQNITKSVKLVAALSKRFNILCSRLLLEFLPSPLIELSSDIFRCNFRRISFAWNKSKCFMCFMSIFQTKAASYILKMMQFFEFISSSWKIQKIGNGLLKNTLPQSFRWKKSPFCNNIRLWYKSGWSAPLGKQIKKKEKKKHWK